MLKAVSALTCVEKLMKEKNLGRVIVKRSSELVKAGIRPSRWDNLSPHMDNL